MDLRELKIWKWGYTSAYKNSASWGLCAGLYLPALPFMSKNGYRTFSVNDFQKFIWFFQTDRDSSLISTREAAMALFGLHALGLVRSPDATLRYFLFHSFEELP